jgi:tRNA (mo5U34)-methyltransferase
VDGVDPRRHREPRGVATTAARATSAGLELAFTRPRLAAVEAVTLEPLGEHALRAAADEITWFHTMDLGQGVTTHGIYDPARTLPRLGLADRLDGQRVLDVGSWDGYFAFEMERRGADVLATDHFCWDGPGWGTKDGFLLAHRARGSSVRHLDIDPLDLTPEAVGGTYDIVLCLGVLYHLRDPMMTLQRLRSVTGSLLVLETEVSMLLTRRPVAAFFPGTELNEARRSACCAPRGSAPCRWHGSGRCRCARASGRTTSPGRPICRCATRSARTASSSTPGPDARRG